MKDSGKSRDFLALRPVSFTRGFVSSAAGSVLAEFGNTRVICNVSVVESVPSFLDPAMSGWLTSEYAMMPAATSRRKARERNSADSRSLEIQRLIGRSLRAAIDLKAFSGITLYVDCDVLEADGGTRTTAVTGAWVALVDALKWLHQEERLFRWPLVRQIAAVSVGLVNDEFMLDLDYINDSRAQFDLNVVMNDNDEFVEIQGTAERGGLSAVQLTRLLEIAQNGISDLFKLQLSALNASSLQNLSENFD